MDRLEYRQGFRKGYEPLNLENVTLGDLYGQAEAQHAERREWHDEAVRSYRPDATKRLHGIFVARLFVEVLILLTLVVIAFQ